jgi:signal transduction histidine kinase
VWISFKRKEFSMEDEIKRAITARVLLSFLILFIALVAMGALNLSSTFEQLEKNVQEQCDILSEFTVSQLLINNASAVQLNLENINRENKLIRFDWIQQGSPPVENKMTWKFPFEWVDYCAIKAKENRNFGYFKVSGSLIYNYEILYVFLMRMTLACVLMFTIFLLLYPLGRRIPQQIFVNPIMELLNLLKRGWKNPSELNDSKMPVEICEIKSKLIQLLKDAESHSHEVAFAQIAAKVAHDIRSPLAALNMLLKKNVAVLPEEEQGIMRCSIERINTIADNLLDSKKEKDLGEIVVSSKTKPELAAVLVKNIVSEKRTQYADCAIQFQLNVNEDASSVFVDVNASELNRALSNLMNNSVEAIEDKGIITLNLLISGQSLLFILEDTGIGMHPEQLSKILEKNISFGKEHGSGIGLSSAIQTIQSSGGVFSIESTFGKGTCVEFELPIVPARFLCDAPDFIFIDDSTYLTDAWQAQASLNSQKLLVFNSVEDVEHYIHLFSHETPLYIDSDLNGAIKGEDLAKTLYEKGFVTIYLCTGRDESDFPEMPWIKKIVGKEYPDFFL